jgi:outer membrane protein OmpA-like peptidoglycan-associated protein
MIVALAVVPLCTGLTIVTAIHAPEGDYESIKRVASMTDREIALQVSAERADQGAVRHLNISRTVLWQDLRSATLYVHHFSDRAARTIPGATALGPSAQILRDLKTKGSAELSVVDWSASSASVDPARHPNLYDFRQSYSLQRIGAATEHMSMLVNGVSVELPVVHARGDNVGDKAEFFFLDDEEDPLALRYRFFQGAGADESLELHVVKISYRCREAQAPQMSALEKSLLETKRAEVYDIYFDFNSERIREESEPTLDEIAAVMRRHPDWSLGVEGHTDNIASEPYNLQLSQRRAAAVVAALTTGHGIAAARLSSSGAGESRPKDTNDTLEGRAHNRRVELVRR